MKCEYCGEKHNGEYGSGRFCDKKCACGFSTKKKRQKINKKIKQSIKNKSSKIKPFKKGFDKRRHIATNKQANEMRKIALKNRFENYKKMNWNELPLAEKRRRVLIEQNNRCLCGLKKWNNIKITLELHHKDGDNTNNKRDNLEILCPNCHSLTKTFRRKKRY